MGKVNFPQGYVKTGGGLGKSIKTLEEALEVQADCSCGGQNCCIGYETIISATTGELLIRYYTGAEGGPYTQVIEPYDTGIANVKALYKART